MHHQKEFEVALLDHDEIGVAEVHFMSCSQALLHHLGQGNLAHQQLSNRYLRHRSVCSYGPIEGDKAHSDDYEVETA